MKAWVASWSRHKTLACKHCHFELTSCIYNPLTDLARNLNKPTAIFVLQTFFGTHSNACEQDIQSQRPIPIDKPFPDNLFIHPKRTRGGWQKERSKSHAFVKSQCHVWIVLHLPQQGPQSWNWVLFGADKGKLASSGFNEIRSGSRSRSWGISSSLLYIPLSKHIVIHIPSSNHRSSSCDSVLPTLCPSFSTGILVCGLSYTHMSSAWPMPRGSTASCSWRGWPNTRGWERGAPSARWPWGAHSIQQGSARTLKGGWVGWRGNRGWNWNRF